MFVFLAALVLLLCAAGGDAVFLLPPRQVRGEASTAMTLCGRDLSEARLLFCTEAGLLQKRAPLTHYMDHPEWLQLEPRRDNSLVSSKDKRGIVDECCYKPCTRDELLNYC